MTRARFVTPIAAILLAVATTAVDAQPTAAKITVTSPTMKEGERMPVDYTADGKNISPPIQWSGLPAGTKEIAMIMDDPVAPTPQPFVHWVIYKIPPTAKGLPENIPIDPAAAMPAELTGAIQGVSGFRRPIYRGPAPPKPGVSHQYNFKVYALDAPLEIAPASAPMTKAQLLEAMKGHIIGEGVMVVPYDRKPPQ
jgi:Raf kinase inhibitor-like YbhB/YbcL family protein